jgi:hypothetical protein
MGCSRLVVLALSISAIFIQALAVPAVNRDAARRTTLDKIVVTNVKQSGSSGIVTCKSKSDCPASTPNCLASSNVGLSPGFCFPVSPQGFPCSTTGDCKSGLTCTTFSASTCVTQDFTGKCCSSGSGGSSAGTTTASTSAPTGTTMGGASTTVGGSSTTVGNTSTTVAGASVTSSETSSTTDTGNSSTSGKSGACVDETWLVRRGYKSRELVHATPVVMDVLCPTGLSLPCGSEHHAVQYAGKTVSYAQLCGSSDVFCTSSRMGVNSLWSFHTHARAGIEVDGATGTRLFMHDVRYSYAQQYALHSVMSAARNVFAF